MKFVRCVGTGGKEILVNLACVSIVCKDKTSDDILYSRQCDGYQKWMAVVPNSDGDRVFKDAIIDI